MATRFLLLPDDRTIRIEFCMVFLLVEKVVDFSASHGPGGLLPLVPTVTENLLIKALVLHGHVTVDDTTSGLEALGLAATGQDLTVLVENKRTVDLTLACLGGTTRLAIAVLSVVVLAGGTLLLFVRHDISPS